ncbi:MAG: GNAT family N-acetyltransferase [Actinomycetota bacterium]|nr:GNAT family N-acetyltransferase [Actinomycetota bacterium]
MLYEAVHWGPEESGPKPPPEELLAEPDLRRYLAGWGREGDFALIARDAEDDRKVGAAWHRLFPASDPGYGFVDAATPDIAIAVAPDRRGTGVGRTLLRALMDVARSDGYGELSLSVQKSNHAAARLYERNGFVRHSDAGNAWIMKAELSADATTNDAH